ERVSGVLAAELLDGTRVYLCAFESGDWLALDDDERPVESRERVHAASSLAALCEVAEESAGGGHLPDLRVRLRELALDEADAAAAELEATIQPPPRLATNGYLDALGAASRRLEQSLGDEVGSPFATALQQALPAVEELAAQVVSRSKVTLT
ncbi:MAG TPA: hypothetical protein VN770_09570, partial [Gaiellaceae bacterium]|nr:hypothetical protein [Gaiellaceae bacterium]